MSTNLHFATSWSVQPLALLAAITAVVWYRRGLRSTGIQPSWPRSRVITFGIGVLVVLVITCGPAAARGHSLYWVWLSQLLALLLIAPILLMSGQPVALASSAAPDGLVARLAGSPAGRACFSPIVGAALVPLACIAIFFGPVPGWAMHYSLVNWTLQILVLILGCVIVLPLVGVGDDASSEVIGAAVAIGFVELLIDAVPGLVMRLSTHPVSTYFDHRTLASSLTPLRDQQIAGSILWCVAELLDLPFLVLVFLRWSRADARQAAAVDAQLDARTAVTLDPMKEDQPWFLTDPQLRDRLR